MISDEAEPPPQQEAAQDAGDVNEIEQMAPARRTVFTDFRDMFVYIPPGVTVKLA